jgi:hypothetical protein
MKQGIGSSIKSIIRKQIITETLWNLAVKHDESYVANGIVVHNCRSLLIPITKYEAFTPSTSVGQKPIDDFIEEKKGTGFSKFTKEIKITDPGVEFIVEDLTPNSQITTYSKDGKVFQKTIITYKTNEKLEVSSVKHLREDDAKV